MALLTQVGSFLRRTICSSKEAQPEVIYLQESIPSSEAFTFEQTLPLILRRVDTTQKLLETMAKLTDLPNELQRAILGYIKVTADLKAVSLVCMKFHTIVAPALYYAVVLPLDSLDERLETSLNPANDNMKHTRALEIVPKDGVTYDHATHGKYLAQLIQSFPRNVLTWFAHDTGSRVPLELTFLMHLRQSNITIYWVYPHCPSPIKPWLQADELQNIVTLMLILDDIEDCQRVSHILWRARHLKVLEIAFGAQGRRTLSHPQALTSLFADRMDPEKAASRMELERLYLTSLNCQHAGSLITSILDVTKLETLELHLCTLTINLLQHLDQHGMRLIRFVQKPQFDRAVSFDSLLGSCDDTREYLVTRVFCASINHGLSLKVIKTRGPSLRVLFIENKGLHNCNYPAGFSTRMKTLFNNLCRYCPNLEQLAIHPCLPPNYLADPEMKTMDASLNSLTQLTKVVSLRLFLIPQLLVSSQHCCVKGKGSAALEADLENQMQATADAVFARLHASCPRFVALQLDAHTAHQSSLSRGTRRFAYLREFRTDGDKPTTVGGREIELRLLRVEEPRNDIFLE